MSDDNAMTEGEVVQQMKLREKQRYAEVMGIELGENGEWPARCDNCGCWGTAPMDEPHKLEGTDIVMMPCRMAPPHIIWTEEHLIDTTEEKFGYSKWPYTAAHWCCGGWKPKPKEEV